MKRLFSLIVSSLIIAMLAVAIVPVGFASADVVSRTIKVGSLSTQRGGVTGALSQMKKKDQSGTADDPSKYVLFSTPDVTYRGTRIFSLPSYVNDNSIRTIRLRVNVKAPSYASQKWIWSAYDWDAQKWVALGNNGSAATNTWSLLTFNFSGNPARFINSSGKVRIQFRSSNAGGNAKIDSEFLLVSYDNLFGGCGETANASFESQVLNLINQRRANNGVPALTRDSRLDTAARLHSADMACNNYFSHTNLLGQSPFQRMSNQGYNYWYAGENIAAGYPTPADVVNAWMNSSGHRANILNSNYIHIGIGYAYYTGSAYWHYWTTDFASPAP